MIVEYCSGGSLLSYLRRSRTDTNMLSLNHQLNMALQVAEGMEYLASKKVPNYPVIQVTIVLRVVSVSSVSIETWLLAIFWSQKREY